jgi:hypothetical protein
MSLKIHGAPSPSCASFPTSFCMSFFEESPIEIPEIHQILYLLNVLVEDAACHLVRVNKETQDDLPWANYKLMQLLE